MEKIRIDLTREQTIKLHRQMWTDMLSELGDNPTAKQRVDFKDSWCNKWCKENGYVSAHVTGSCFLCEYTRNKGIVPSYLECNVCPINWTKAEDILVIPGQDAWCVSSYIPTGKDYFLTAPISKILAIPERE